MRRYGWLLLAPLAALVLVGGASQAAPAKACRTGAIVRVTNGKRTCAPARAFRQRITTVSPSAAMLARTLGESPVALRLKNGKVVRSVIPPRLAAAAVRGYAGLEADLTAAVRGAQAQARVQAATARENGVTVTRGSVSPVTLNADGSASQTGSISAALDGPGNVVVDLGLTASSTGSLGLDVNITFDGADGARSSRGFTIRDLLSKPVQDCPSATGEIRFQNHFGGGGRSSENFDATRAKLGTVREATTLDVQAQATAHMGPDARLQPFTFSVASRFDYSRSAQVLAFLSSRTRSVGTATLTGRMDPATGQVSGATISTNVRTSGFGGEAAAAEAATRAVLGKVTNEEGGRVLKGLRAVETKARGGACTTLVLTPSSPSALAPKATKNVVARLETKDGGTDVRTVRWAAVASKGSVSPSTSRAPQPTLGVKGAAAGPETARINVRAVSPAGISEGPWVGTADRFPASYSGTVSYSGSLGVITEDWQGAFTYAGPVVTTNPDRSLRAVYPLSSATVQSHTGSGECSWTSGPGGTIHGGDLVITVDSAGAWTSALVIDVVMPSVQRTCQNLPSGPIEPLAALNTRALAGSALRGMPPGGEIAGAGVTDTLNAAVLPATASWDLAPGS